MRFYVGIDVASETLAVAVTPGPAQPTAAALAITNDPEGFAAFDEAIRSLGASTDNTLVCLEATGVYGEALCYWLHGRGYRVAVEDAARVRRAMPIAGAKTDALDARRIADYAARYLDELRPWTPADAVVEQVQTLLTMREQLVREEGSEAERAPRAPAEGGPDAARAADRRGRRGLPRRARPRDRRRGAAARERAPDDRPGRGAARLDPRRGAPPRRPPLRGHRRVHAPARAEAALGVARDLPA